MLVLTESDWTSCHGLVDKMEISQRLDSSIFEIFSNLNYSVVSLYRTWTSKYFHDGRQCHRSIFVFLLVNSRYFMISTTEVLSLIYFLGNAENILPSTQG